MHWNEVKLRSVLIRNISKSWILRMGTGIWDEYVYIYVGMYRYKTDVLFAVAPIRNVRRVYTHKPSTCIRRNFWGFIREAQNPRQSDSSFHLILYHRHHHLNTNFSWVRYEQLRMWVDRVADGYCVGMHTAQYGSIYDCSGCVGAWCGVNRKGACYSEARNKDLVAVPQLHILSCDMIWRISIKDVGIVMIEYT